MHHPTHVHFWDCPLSIFRLFAFTCSHVSHQHMLLNQSFMICLLRVLPNASVHDTRGQPQLALSHPLFRTHSRAHIGRPLVRCGSAAAHDDLRRYGAPQDRPWIISHEYEVQQDLALEEVHLKR
jgi:hypothetical protein